ncbi:MAG: hypothetical protein CML22_06625 [Rheinheimera sp.]|nr:hypothetical protein [Rheinheimera sp.]MBM33956.1 hypothetical protein [Rheinheimera sp.]
MNAEINMLVSEWFSQQYTLFDMSVSLKDVSEDYLVKVLETHIDESGLQFGDLKLIAVIPALAGNKRDLLVKVMAMPSLLAKMLGEAMVVEYGFWSEHDKATIKDSGEHIVIKKGRKKGALCGLYLNGTLANGDVFSFYYNASELEELFRVARAEKFNGVEVADEALIGQFVLKSIFYRLIDSDIGFQIEMEWPDVYRAVKGLVWPSEDISASVEDNLPIFSSWGARIGVAYRAFDITDAKKAETAEMPKPKKHLAVVVNNESVTDSARSNSSHNEEDIMQDWGRF